MQWLLANGSEAFIWRLHCHWLKCISIIYVVSVRRGILLHLVSYPCKCFVASYFCWWKQHSPHLPFKDSLPHWGRDKMAAILQTFSNVFSPMKMFELRIKFHWSLFLMVQLTMNQHCFRLWLGVEQVPTHYLKQWWPSSMTYICGTWPKWVKVAHQV